jgi:S-formylglutathione hydrolase FrmB
MNKFFIHFIITLFYFSLSAKQVETVTVSSLSMNISVENVIILPKDYDEKDEFPVIYLLHGYSGDHKSWLNIKPDLPDCATRLGVIIVCPNGRNSWYWDSPVNSKSRYETYAAKELIDFMDKNYKTIKNKSGRAITGLSMGGHGGLWLGIRHQDVFGACGSTSGGVDIRPFPDNWEMKDQLGLYAENKEVWNSHTVINQLYLIKPELGIIIDCGTEDFFYEVNKSLHEEMLYKNTKHEFIVRPGAHNAEYWRKSIEYQFLFFYNFFQKK